MIEGFSIEITEASLARGLGTAICPGMQDGKYDLHGWFRRPDGYVVGFFKQRGSTGSSDRLGNRSYHGAVYYIALIEPIEWPSDPPVSLIDARVVPRKGIPGMYRIAKVLHRQEPGRRWRNVEHDFAMRLRHLAYDHVGSDLVQPRRGRYGHFETSLIKTRDE